MNKRKISIAVLGVILLFNSNTVLASPSESNNVGKYPRIHEVALDNSISYESNENLTSSESILPIDIIQNNNSLEIRKVYELPPDTNPDKLPRNSFERNGILYNCTDILREVVIGEDTQTVRQTETIESSKNDMDTILGLLKETKEITTDDGYSGVLKLDISSIKTEVSGYGNGTKKITATRQYPNLSNADTQYIPKTIEDNGRTLTLETVNWRSDNTMNVDDYPITDRYTAVATYTGTASTSYIKGYTVTADYSGEVLKMGVSKIRYTVIYNGTLIEIPSFFVSHWQYITILLFIIVAVIITAVAIILKRRRKEELRKFEENNENNYHHNVPDDSISSTDTGRE